MPVPGLRSFLAPHPDRSHQGSPITPRRTAGAESYAQGVLSVPPFGRHSRILLSSEPKMPSSLPHSHLSMRSAIQTGVRGSIRPGRGAYRADLAPVGFNTAPSQRAGNRRSNRYAAFGHSIVFSMTIPLRYASVTAPASKGQVPRRQLRYAASGLSIDTLWTQGASKGRSDRRLLFQLSPMKRPLRARDPNGSCAFAVAPYCGGSYLTPAKWQICGGSCSQKPRTRVRTGGAVSPRLRRGL